MSHPKAMVFIFVCPVRMQRRASSIFVMIIVFRSSKMNAVELNHSYLFPERETGPLSWADTSRFLSHPHPPATRQVTAKCGGGGYPRHSHGTIPTFIQMGIAGVWASCDFQAVRASPEPRLFRRSWRVCIRNPTSLLRSFARSPHQSCSSATGLPDSALSLVYFLVHS